jgi:hypothetical protein
MFTITFRSETFGAAFPWPSIVRLRTSIDGWLTNLPGQVDADQATRFELDAARYAQGFEFKLVLASTLGEVWMDGSNLTLNPADGQTYEYGDEAVRFPFMISYVTSPYSSPGTITLRTSLDDWSSEQAGSLAQDSWDFRISFADCTDFGSGAVPPIKRVAFKFLRDGGWAKTANLMVIPWPGARFVYTFPDVAF